MYEGGTTIYIDQYFNWDWEGEEIKWYLKIYNSALSISKNGKDKKSKESIEQKKYSG